MKLYDAAGEILAGTRTGKEVELHGNPVSYVDFGFASFLCPPSGETK